MENVLAAACEDKINFSAEHLGAPLDSHNPLCSVLLFRVAANRLPPETWAAWPVRDVAIHHRRLANRVMLYRLVSIRDSGAVEEVACLRTQAARRAVRREHRLFMSHGARWSSHAGRITARNVVLLGLNPAKKIGKLVWSVIV